MDVRWEENIYCMNWILITVVPLWCFWWIYGCWGFNRQKYIEWEERTCIDAENYGTKILLTLFSFLFSIFLTLHISHPVIHLFTCIMAGQPLYLTYLTIIRIMKNLFSYFSHRYEINSHFLLLLFMLFILTYNQNEKEEALKEQEK